ncbi:hypothetical protein QF027_001828 [Streptomyces canus]|nr:hypothetical protein [Streptomyces canus]
MAMGIQPSARSTSRSIAFLLEEGSRTGMGRARLGLTAAEAIRVWRPSYRTGSGPHTGRQTSMISSRPRPRSAKGPTPAAAYSSVDQPLPRPATTRPPLAASNVARDLASWNGPCSGATRTLVPSSARSVPATTGASVTRAASGTPRYWPGQGTSSIPPRPCVGGAGNRAPS